MSTGSPYQISPKPDLTGAKLHELMSFYIALKPLVSEESKNFHILNQKS